MVGEEPNDARPEPSDRPVRDGALDGSSRPGEPGRSDQPDQASPSGRPGQAEPLDPSTRILRSAAADRPADRPAHDPGPPAGPVAPAPWEARPSAGFGPPTDPPPTDPPPSAAAAPGPGAAGAAPGPVPAAGPPTAPGWAGTGAPPPPPGAPPGFGPPPGYGPPGYGPPPGDGGQPPTQPRGEANGAQAALIGLLNLSCLGLGYVLLRNWIGAALCWIATAALLFLALPADVDGVPAGLLVGYGVFLLAVAADGARRGLRATLPIGASFRRLALPLALVLLAVPAGGSLAYGAARDEAKEQALLDRLAAADELVKSADGLGFATAEPTFRKALGEYAKLAEEHAGSRAGKLVPARLDTYFATISKPYADKVYCDAIPRLTYLRGLPATVDKDLLGTRPAKTDEPLAHSLYECGAAGIGNATYEPDPGKSFGELLKTFPKSSYAPKVAPAFEASIRTRTDDLAGGGTPCATTKELHTISASLDGMTDPSVEGAADQADAAVQKGDFACGTYQFKNKDFKAALDTMTAYAKDYPSSPQAAHARSIAIAAEIAEEEPAAGGKLPPADAPGGTRMVMVVSNDGPGEVELLYTGPLTGKVTLNACGTCTKYPSPIFAGSKKIKACTGPSSKYPKATLLLPAGDYHFLQKRVSTGTSTAGDTKSSKAKIEPGYSYTNCLYVTSGF
ncbi:hypothetical protein ACFTY9_10040 [Streptomyces sp. NPDC057021]|uniref:hypothetical protein n=2 Tax=unclassified Streptomyces TaxID=2593676 RepID=UPI00362EF7DD